MTQYNPVFNPQEYELRNYTSPYLTPDQSQQVADTETRVNGELNFVAQMLGWSGPNYWSSLASTVSQKRQLLGGCLLYTSPSPRDRQKSRMPSSA